MDIEKIAPFVLAKLFSAPQFVSFKMLSFFFFLVGFVFLYILDMDSMNEENDEYGDTVSSAPKRMRCRTSSIWSDFEILLKSSNGKERAKCKKCQNSFVAGSSGTTSLLRHRAKCHEVDNQIVSRQPLDQAKYREMVALEIIRHNYPFSFAKHENNRLLHCFIVIAKCHRSLVMSCLQLLMLLGTLMYNNDIL